MVEYDDSHRLPVLAMTPFGRKILDVGCWMGAYGAALAEQGAEVWGIEPNRHAAEVAERRLSKVIVGAFPADAPEGERFDGIVFNDVLEHMADPEAALKVAGSLLERDGWVLASIPNIRHYTVWGPLVMRGRFDYQDTGILDRTHLKHFTRATIREMFEGCGYRIERLEPINLSRPRGKWRCLTLLGSRSTDLVAAQYVVVARQS